VRPEKEVKEKKKWVQKINKKKRGERGDGG
jgi:hypothetical protein